MRKQRVSPMPSLLRISLRSAHSVSSTHYLFRGFKTQHLIAHGLLVAVSFPGTIHGLERRHHLCVQSQLCRSAGKFNEDKDARRSLRASRNALNTELCRQASGRTRIIAQRHDFVVHRGLRVTSMRPNDRWFATPPQTKDVDTWQQE